MNKKTLIIIGLVLCFLFTLPMVSAADFSADSNLSDNSFESNVNSQYNATSNQCVLENNVGDIISNNGGNKLSTINTVVSNSDNSSIIDISDLKNKDYNKNIDNILISDDKSLKEKNILGANNLNADGIGNTFADLQFLIDNNIDLTLDKDYIFNSESDSGLTNGIKITGTITINGNGHKIDAKESGRIFLITGDNVVLNNIIFVNAKTSSANSYNGNGGSVYIDSDGKATQHTTVKDCTFINSSSLDGDGGGIYFITPLLFDNFTGINCHADNGGGGAIYAFTNGSGNGAQGFYFYNNTAKNGGAAYLYGNNIVARNIHAVGNNASGNGGTIYSYGNATYLYNGNFINNTAKSSTSNGGAIYFAPSSGDSLLNNTIFINNTAGRNGGAIDWAVGAFFGELYNSKFYNNTASRSAGAVYWSGNNGTIGNCIFEDNKALGTSHDEGDIDPTDTSIHLNGGDGGAVIWTGSIGNVYNSSFKDNYAINRGGAIYLQGGYAGTGDCQNTTINLCNFTHNNAGLNGGAIDWHEGSYNGTVKYSNFINNTAARSGGAIYWKGNLGKIEYSNFTYNSANGTLSTNLGGQYTTSGGNGGAFIATGSNITVIGSNFTNNSAKNRGGAVYLQYNENDTFNGCWFENNTAGYNGGALDFYQGSKNGAVINSTFVHNIAKNNGGGIYWNGEKGIINGSFFYNNSALNTYAEGNGLGGDGGAVIWTGSDGLVENSTFINNSALYRGGAIFLQKLDSDDVCENITVKNCTFELNHAGTNGGAIDWYRGAFNGTLDTSIFKNNTAGRSGGAVYWSGEYGKILNSSFVENFAYGTLDHDNRTEGPSYDTLGGNGGAIVVIGNNINVTNCNFTSNNASKLGGAVYLHNNENGSFDKCNFTSNFAGVNGGALDFYAGASNGRVLNSVFNENIANRSGGAIYWSGTNGNITNSNFTNNTAKGLAEGQTPEGETTTGGDGGAIIWTGSYGVVEYSNFYNNSARFRGGAIFLQKSSGSENATNTSVRSSVFKFNHAGTNGGAVDWSNGSVNGIVFNTTFENNTANRSGGAVYWYGEYGNVLNSTFNNNTALGDFELDSRVTYDTKGGNGGAIVVTGSYIDIIGSNFTNNTASKLGGVIYFHNNEKGTVDTCQFNDNFAGVNGGALDFHAGAKDGEVLNSNFTNNTAKRNGGAIFWDGYDGTVKNSIFDNNRATGEALLYEGIILNMSDGDIVILSNESVYDSFDLVTGKIYVEDNSTSKTDIFYTLYVYDGTQIILLDSLRIENNTNPSPTDWAIDQFFGGNGGSILWSGDLGLVDNCTFIRSNSARRGGGAYMTGSDNVTYQNSKFINCTSGTNGGGVDWLAGANYGKIINCNFSDTRAARSAGAIYYDGDYGEIINVNIINTTANGGSLKESDDHLVKYVVWDTSHWDTNTTGGDAGAIMFTGSHIRVSGSNFTNCTAVGRGGAIFLQDNTNITFENCTFENNTALGTANNTWANYAQERDDSNRDTKVDYKLTGHGGAISFDFNATEGNILNSIFINNSAHMDGGAINYAKGATKGCINNTKFYDNIAGDDGGAVNWEGDEGTIFNITADNNKAISLNGSNSKGGTFIITGNKISFDTVNITNSYAQGETGINNGIQGGAIFITGNECNITNIEITNSTVKFEGDDASGGAIYIIGNKTNIANGKFINNTAYEDGGAIYVSGQNVTLINTEFYNNTAHNDGGAIEWQGNNGKVYNLTADNNYADSKQGSSKGGTIIMTGNNVTIDKVNITNSYVDGQDYSGTNTVQGGAIFITGNDCNITNSEFTNCSVRNTVNEANGGAIYIIGNHTIILNSYFTNNTVPCDGGAIYVLGSHVNITDSNFTYNNASRNGGAIFLINNTNSTIDNSDFEYNYAGLNGGAIDFYTGASNGYILNSRFVNNTAKRSGGSVYWNGVNGTIKNSNFTDNKALGQASGMAFDGTISTGGDGGAIIWTGHNGTIDNCRFINNSALLRGGAAYLQNSTNGLFNNSYFGHNTAGTNGGAIDFHEGASNGIIENTGFEYNTAGTSGGSVFWQGTLGQVINCNFTGSRVKGNGSGTYNGKGGTIIWLGDDGEISACLFNDSESKSDGSVLYIIGDEVNTRYSNFTNSLSNGSGTIFLEGAHAKIDECHIENTTVKEIGGAIYVHGHFVKISNTDIVNSSSVNEGSGIYVTGDNSEITATNISNSKTSSGSGTIYIAGYNTKVSNSNLNNNSAANGAGIYVRGNSAKILNTNITNSNASNYGGGIYLAGNSALVEGCNLNNNRARNGACVYMASNSHNNTIQSSNISNSYASNFGGGLDWDVNSDNGLIQNCTFYNLTSLSHGGALHWYGGENGNVDNCTFIECQVLNTANGGAIYAGQTGRLSNDITISNTNFINCTSGSRGSVNIMANNAHLINNTFINSGRNYTDNTAWGGVQALQLQAGDNIEIINNTFINCTSVAYGAINVGAGQGTSGLNNVSIINSTFDGCNVIKGSGAAVYLGNIGSNAIIDGCTFVNNTASNSAGALYTAKQNVTISNSEFIGNLINGTGSNYGGAVYIEGTGTNLVSNNTFVSNTAQNTAGGAIFWKNNGNNTLENNEFINNTAGGNGGAAFINNDIDVFNNNTFINNTAKGSNGGAVELPGNIYVNNSTFIENIAINEGGAIHTNGYVYVNNSYFEHNKAVTGSAIRAGNINLNNSILLENQAHFNRWINNQSSFTDTHASINATFVGYDNMLNAMTANGFAVINVTYWGVNGAITNTDSSSHPASYNEVNQLVVLEVYNENNELINTFETYTDANGKFNFEVDMADAKNAAYKVYHPEDWYYTYAEYTIGKANVTVQLTSENITHPEDEHIVVTVIGGEGTPTGVVLIYINDSFGTVIYNQNQTLDSGSYNLVLPRLNVTEYNVYVRYYGSEVYLPGNASSIFHVDKAESYINIDAKNYTYNETGNITISIPYVEDAKVTVVISNENFSQLYTVYVENDDTIKIELPILDAGEYQVDAIFNGTNNYYSSHNVTNFTVSKAASIIDVTAENVTGQERSNVNIHVDPEISTQTVDVIVYDENGEEVARFEGLALQNSASSIRLPTLTKGEYNVAVTYGGDKNHNNSYNETIFYVTNNYFPMSIEAVNMTYGNDQIINITVPISPNPTNPDKLWIKLNWTENDTVTNLGYAIGEDGIIHIDTTDLASRLDVGNYTIEVCYEEDDNYLSNSSSFIFEVIKTNVTMTVAPQNISFVSIENITIEIPELNEIGQNESLTIYVNSTNNESIRFVINNYDIGADGKAIWNVNSNILPAGDYIVEAVYEGSVNFNPINKTAAFKVSKAEAWIEIDVNNIFVGESEVINVTVHPNGENGVTGNVTIYVRDKVETIVLDENGQANYTLSNEVEGTGVTVIVFYEGDNNYNQNLNSTHYNVTKQNTTTVVDALSPINYGTLEDINITVNFTDAIGTITLYINSTLDGFNNITKVFYLDGTENGKVNWDIDELKLPVGSYDIVAIYSGDSKYNNSSSQTKVVVVEKNNNYTIFVEANNTVYGNNQTIIVTLPDDADGTVTIVIEGTDISLNKAVEGGKVVFVVPEDGVNFLEVHNDYKVTATYNGGTNYEGGKTVEDLFNVTKAESHISVISENIDYKQIENITISLPDTNASGRLVITITNKSSGQVVKTQTVDVFTTTDGVIYPFECLERGNYTVKVEYSNDHNYEYSDDSKDFEVYPIDADISESSPDIVYGNDETIIVSVPSDATGTVKVLVDGVEIGNKSIGVDDLVFTVFKPAVNAKHNITVVYSGDDNYNGGTIVGEFAVSQNNSFEIMESSPDIDYGNDEVIVITVPDDAVGTVYLVVNGSYYAPVAIDDDHQAIFTIVVPVVGNYNFTAYYSGDGNYVAKNIGGVFDVIKADVDLSESHAASVVYGADNIISVTINGVEGSEGVLAPGGTIKVLVDGVEIGNKTIGYDSLSFVSQKPFADMEHNITVVYSGDDNYNGKSITGQFEVTQNVVVISEDSPDICYGENETIAVTIVGDATGTIAVSVGGEQIGEIITITDITEEDKVFTFNITKPDGGLYDDLTIVYGGDSNYATKTITGEFTVSPIEPLIVENSPDIVYGNDETITITVPEGASGIIAVTVTNSSGGLIVDSRELIIGLDDLEIDISKPNADNYTIGIAYSGCDNYTTKTIEGKFEVTKSSNGIAVLPTNITYGQTETITVTVPEGATGSVTIILGTYIDTKEIASGSSQVEFSIPKTESDTLLDVNNNYVVFANYSGDSNYESAISNNPFHVSPANVTLSIQVANITYGEDEIVNITVLGVEGAAIPSGFVTIRLNGTDIELSKRVNGEGKVSFNVTGLVVGEYNLTAVYESSTANYNDNQLNAHFNVSKADIKDANKNISTVNITYGDNETIAIKFNENIITGNVTITIGVYTDTKELDNGQVVFTVTHLEANNYTVVANYSGDDNYNGISIDDGLTDDFTVSKANVTVTVSPRDIVYKEIGEINVTVTGVLIDGEASDTLAKYNLTSKVTIYIDGIENQTKEITEIDENGILHFNVEGLVVGEHNVSAKYWNDRNYNDNTATLGFNVANALPENMLVNTTNITYHIESETIVIDLGEVLNGTLVVYLNTTEIYNDEVIDKDHIVLSPIENLEVANYTVRAVFAANDDTVETINAFEVKKAPVVVNVEPLNISYGQVENISVLIDNTISDKFNLTGSVTIYINGREIETKVIVSDGRLIFNVEALEAANGYNVTAIYHNDNNYMDNQSSALFNVTRSNVGDFNNGTYPELNNNISSVNITYGGDETIALEFSENNITGKVTIAINGEEIETKDLIGGKVVFTLSNLEVNNYTVVANYSGDANYNAKEGISSIFRVDKDNSTVVVLPAPAVIYGNNETIIVSVPIRNHTGAITLTINGSDYVFIKHLTAEDGDSIVLNNISGLAVGTYNVAVKYGADRNYNDSQANALFEVIQATPSQMTIEAQNITYTEDEIIVVKVLDANATGNVTIAIGSYTNTIELVNGVAKFNVTGLVVGYYTVEANYSGDANYISQVASLPFHVGKASSNLTIEVANITYCDIENANITIINYNASGRVIIKVDGKPYGVLPINNNTPVNLALSDLAVGTHTIDVEYFDDVNYNSSIAHGEFNVIKATIPIGPENESSLIVVPVNITYLNYETVVVSVGANNATGNVTIAIKDEDGNLVVLDSSVVISKNITQEASQSVTFNVPGLVVGNFTVEVKYSDDANYEDAETSAGFEVSPANSTVVVEAVNITYNDNETITVSVPIFNASGTITVKLGDDIINVTRFDGVDSPSIEIIVPGLSVGNYNVTVTYDGDVNYNDSDAIALFHVDKASIPKEAEDTGKNGLVVNGTNITYNDDETIVVIVDVPNATGNVTIFINDVEIETKMVGVGGTVSFTVSDLEVGEYNVTAKYFDDVNYEDTESTNQFAVIPDASGIYVVPINIVYNDDETINVTVPIINASGKVTITINGTGVEMTGSVDGDGKAVFVVPGLVVGEYNVTAVYHDDVNYNDSESSALFNVTRSNVGDFNNGTYPGLNNNISSVNITYGGNETITLVFGENNITGNVTIVINDMEIDTKPLENGRVTFTVSDLEVNNYIVVANYSGDANYNAKEGISSSFTVSKANSTVELSVVNIVYNDNETIAVTVPIVNASGTISVKVGEDLVNITSFDGVDSPSVEIIVPGLAVGNYNVTVTYGGDVNYNDSNASKLFNVTKAMLSNIVIVAENSTYGQVEHINVTVDDSNATGKVTITILNGSTVYTETLELVNGFVEFNISGLPAKLDYIVFAEYYDDVNYETIEIFEPFSIYKAATQTTIEVNNISYGENEIINLTVSGLNVLDFAQNPSMYLRLKVNDTVIVLIGELDDNAKLSFNISGLVAGNYSVLANYNGDGNYNESHVISEFTVDKANIGEFNNGTNPELENNISAMNITYCDNEIITLEFSEKNITGSVAIVIRDSIGNNIVLPSDLTNKTISHAIVSFVIPDLQVDNYTVIASYSGDANYNAKEGINVVFTVSKANSTVGVIPTDIDYGKLESMNLNVSVANASGKANITIYDNDNNEVISWIENNVGSGIKTVIYPDILAGGTYTVNVTYFDDVNYENSSANAQFNVNSIEPVLSEISPNISYGLDEIIEIYLIENASGELNLTVRGGNTYPAVPIEGVPGKYIVTISKLDAGNYYFDISYGGDANYTAKTISGEFNVSKATNATLEVIGGEFAYGEAANVQVNLTDGDEKLTGIVKLTVGGTGYYVDVFDGLGEINITGLSSGTHPIIAEFIGNENYEGTINDSAQIIVNASTDAVISAEVDDIIYGENATVNGTVIDGEGKLINGTVLMSVDGKEAVEVDVIDGIFEYPIENLAAGNHTIFIEAVDYDADPVELNVTVDKAEAKINAENTNDAKYGEDVIVNIGLVDNHNNPINGTVILSVDGEDGFTVEVDADSVDEYLSDLSVGNHTVVISLVDDNYSADDLVLIVEIAKAASENVTIAVSPTKDEFVYGEDASLDIEVTGINRTPIEGIVIITVDGTDYAVNLTDGKARLTIPGLGADDYSVKAVFAGNDEYGSASNEEGIIHILKAYPLLAGETDDIIYGEAIELNVNLTGNGDKLYEDITVTIYNQDGIKLDEISLNLSNTDTLSVPNLEKGDYYFILSFGGNDNFNGVESEKIPFAVNAAYIGLVIVPAINNIIYGDEIPLVITVTGVDEPVDVLINVTDSKGNLIIEDAPLTVNGSNTFIIPDGYDVGDYNVSVVAIEGTNHNGIINTTNFTINKAKAVIVHQINSTVYADKPIVDILDVIGVYNESLSGLITVSYYDYDNQTNKTYLRYIYGNATDGKLLLEIQRFAAGNHELFISFENGNYDSYPHPASAIVEKMVPNLTATVKNISVGDNATIKIENRGYLGESINENITIYINSEYYDTVMTVDAYNTSIVEGLPVGNYTVLVVYGGNENYTENFYSVSFNVSKNSANNVSLALSVPQSQYSYGDNATVDINLTGLNNVPINGTVLVTVDGKDYTVEIIDGKGSLNVSGLDVGKYPVVAQFIGNDEYEPSESKKNATIKVVPADNVNLTVSGGEYDYGSPATVNINLNSNGTPLNGKVIVNINHTYYEVNVVDGFGSVDVYGLASGEYPIIARFVGDNNHKSSRSNDDAKLLINPSKEAQITASVDDIVYGEDAKLEIMVLDGENKPISTKAEVTVDGGEPIEVDVVNGKAVLPIEGLEQGKHNISVSLLDNDYDVEPVNTSLNVESAELNVGLDTNEPQYGENATVVIDAKDKSGKGINGTAKVIIGDKEMTVDVVDGKAIVDAGVLDAGDYPVTVEVISDNYEPIVQSTTLTVSKLNNARITVSAEDIKLGESEEIEIILTDDNGNPIGGIVKLIVGENDYFVNVTGGKSTVSIRNLDLANYIVNALFLGNKNYDGVSNTTEFAVNALKNVLIDIVPGDGLVNIILTDEDGEPVNGYVNLTIDGETQEVELVEGKASIPTSSGTKVVTVNYPGDADHDNASATKKINVKLIPTQVSISVDNITYTQNVTIDLGLKDINGIPLSGVLPVSLDGKKYNVTMTNGLGHITIPKLDAGNYTVLANYSGNNKYNSSFAVQDFSVKRLKTYFVFNNMDTYAVELSVEGRVGEYFYAQLVDEFGNPLANRKVQIGFNGKIYNRTTNATGGFSLQVNLKHSANYTFALYHAQDNNYEAAFGSARIQVFLQTPTMTVNVPSYKASVKNKTITAKLVSKYGTPVKSRRISVIVDGRYFSAYTNSKGVATIKLSLNKKGTYSFAVKFEGDDCYKFVTKSTSMKIT